jgi:energy-coupling factor transporter ATP-binding protein EcfA2
MPEENTDRGVSLEVPLSFVQVCELVRGLVRYPNLLQSALRIGFRADQFNNAQEMPLYVLTNAVIQLQQAHGTVTQTMVMTEISSWLEMGAEQLSPQNHEFLFGSGADPGFIADAFEPVNTNDRPQMIAERQYVEQILRRFLNARLVRRQLKDLIVSSTNESVPANFKDMLADFKARAEAVTQVGRDTTNAAEMPAFGGHIPLPPPFEPTTVPWVDNFIGGFRRGDMLGLIGPYSGGKTTMLSSLAVRLAQRYAATNSRRLSVYICYEDGAAKMNHMFWSAAAHIDRRLFAVESEQAFWEGFSTRENPKEYDRRLPENRNGQIIMGERERWLAVLEWFNRHFVFLDFSANSDTGGRGSGGVPEIVSALHDLSDRRNMEIGFVGVDYSMLLLNRELAQDRRTRNMEQVWRVVQQLPDNLRTMVAVPFGATVMLAHQLAGSDIKHIPPWRHVGHLDAMGSKAFAENLHACACVNAPDPETKVQTLNWSKIRAGRPDIRTGLIRIDDHVVDVPLVDDQYMINEFAKKIQRRNEVEPVQHGAVAAPAQNRRRVIPIDTFSEDM